jgi:chromosome segregation ATPase
MSGDPLALAAFLGAMGLLAILWLAGRRKPPEPLPRRAERSEPRVVTAQEALTSVRRNLETALELLREVDTIGLWVRSDDCSDNRRKREGLREMDLEVSSARRAVADISPPFRDARLDELENDLRTLRARTEPLPATVIDTGENPELDGTIRSLTNEIEQLQHRVSLLAAELRTQPSISLSS